MQPKIKEPILAAVLSLFLGGVGQIYLGQMAKGVAVTAVVLLLDFLFLCLGFAPLGLGPIGLVFCTVPGLLALLVAVVSALDAYVLAGRVNSGQTLGEWESFTSAKK